MTIYYGGGRMQGKSWDVQARMFNNWLVTNFCPLPDNDTQYMMWQAWLKSSMVMKAAMEDKAEDYQPVIWWEDV